MRIEVRNLKRYFGTTRAVDDVSFSFESGQIFGFIGPNGAGKTTTMRIMATLDEPTAGDAALDGVSIVQEPEAARRMVGFMPDTLPTHRDISVHEYLDFFARAYDLRGDKRKSVVDGIEQFTNLRGIRDKMLNALSKGMKQRVSLARALIHDPPLLIMDEPAAGLDPRARVELRELLKALGEQGKAILISSHILSELHEICDGAVFIEHGKLLRAGTLDQIINHDRAEKRITVTIRPLDRVDDLYKELLQTANVEDVRLAGREVEAQIAGDEAMCCDILEGLLRQSFRILEFKQRQTHLEEIFMNITTGQVQ